MTNFSELRVFLCMTPTSMSFSFDRLMGIAERTFNQDPLSGHLFLFVNRYRNRIKILFWDRDGFCIWYKRLERGVFELPTRGPAGVEWPHVAGARGRAEQRCFPGLRIDRDHVERCRRCVARPDARVGQGCEDQSAAEDRRGCRRSEEHTSELQSR